MLLQIYKLIDAHEEVLVIYREANQCANALARGGIDGLVDLELRESVPNSVTQFVTQDKSGICFSRFIVV